MAKNKSNPSLRDSDPGSPVNGYYAGRYTQGIDEDHPRVSKTRLRYTRIPYNRLLIWYHAFSTPIDRYGSYQNSVNWFCSSTKLWRERRGCLPPSVCCLDERGICGHGNGLTRQTIICHLTAYVRHTKVLRIRHAKRQKWCDHRAVPVLREGEYKKCIKYKPKRYSSCRYNERQLIDVTVVRRVRPRAEQYARE